MRQIFKSIISIIVIVLLFTSCKKIAAGSYPYTEDYSIAGTKEELIENIAAFKTMYPQYSLLQTRADGSIKGIKDQYRENTYLVYFYLANPDLLIHCIIRRETNDSTWLEFYAISYTNFGGGKE